MQTDIKPLEDRSQDGYDELLSQLVSNFTATTKGDSYLFTTDATGLFDAFLAALPDEARQHYTCNACRKFIDTYGSLVTVGVDGSVSPILWQYAPEVFKLSIMAVRSIVKRSNITGVFVSDKATLGTPVTGEWCHMHVTLPSDKVYRGRGRTAYQVMAERKEDYGILERSLAEFSQATVEQAVTLLNSEQLYRSDKCLGVAKWLLQWQKLLAMTQNVKERTNLIWLAVASAPTGYCHVRSSMIGTLLDDIAAGMDFAAVSSRFAEKMNPANYQRSRVAPTVGNVRQAEKLVEKLGLQNSLQRRYMTVEEIPTFVWRPLPSHPVKASFGGVFADVVTKQKTTPAPTMELPAVTMTWDKFQRTVLPKATKIEVKAENSQRFAALVTAVHPDSENILQWNNGASWYYHGGVDAEIRRRVESAGGKYDNNEIRCSLAWDNYTDLDLHCTTPNGEHIYFGNKRDRCGGWLDVDANGGSATTMTPVENIRWATAVAGKYQFWLHNYSERGSGSTKFKAELMIGPRASTFEGVIGGTGSRVELAMFNYERGVTPSLRGLPATSVGTAWGLEMNRFYPVTGIVKSPNLWGDKPVQHAGDHTFFLLDGCKDTEEGKGRGFFNEMLKPELREIRKTLEAYTTNTPIAGGENASACGLGYSKDGEWGMTLRVTSGAVVATYKLDRMD